MGEVFVRKGVHEHSVAAIAFVTEVPAESIAGYVAVAVQKDGSYMVAANSCCMLHATAALAQAITAVAQGQMCSSDAVT